MTDPFAAYAEERGVKEPPQRQRGPKVVQSEKDAPMVPSPMEKQMREKSAQMARYRRSKRKERGELRDALPEVYGELARLLRRLPDSARELVIYLREAWVLGLTRQQQMVVIGMIDDRIALKRQMDGRPPFDDPLMGEPDNLFLICRKAIMGH
jgi:hypothetical protein